MMLLSFCIWTLLLFQSSTLASFVVINTWATDEFQKANAKAYSVLQKGGNALDAVEIGCNTCEKLQCDTTVGFGGSPDENSETTLDAMIMDGKTMNAGSVAALRNIKDAVSVARKVMENTAHTMLVGSQATEFAIQMGFSKESLTTSFSLQIWKDWKAKNCQPNFWVNVQPDPKKSCGPYHPTKIFFNSDKNNTCERKNLLLGLNNHDTIGMVALDSDNNMAVATSTNGARHKIPGRVGDSPIIGSGGYVENGVGAAAATGDGDIMMRFVPSFKAVEGLRRGLAPQEAADDAIKNIKKYFPDFMGGIVVLSASGQFAAACHGMDKFPFSVAQNNEKTRVIEVNCH